MIAEPSDRLNAMRDWVTPRQFSEAPGTEDWRVLMYGACTYFRTASFAQGVQLVGAIGLLAAAVDHYPDIDLRPRGVSVRVMTGEERKLSSLDVELARQISAAARELGVSVDLAAVNDVHVTIDALATEHVRPFWRALLGYRDLGDEDLLDPSARGPSVWFQPMKSPRIDRNRLHVDVAVPHDQAEARIAAAIAAGGHLVSDHNAPSWWVLADVEGNEACVATWLGRGG
jgi:4a-hydroxytetrahydrobiopterin dehydratase